LEPNNIRFVISMINCVDWYKNRDPFVGKNFSNFLLWGIPHEFFEKNVFIERIRILCF
jgi:hypothetical protein